MNRVCTHCRSVADAENVYCPVCGKRLEENTGKKKGNDFLSSVLGTVKTFTEAFFEPMSFYRKAADEKLVLPLVFPAVFYIFFFSGIIAEKTLLGYFSAVKCVIFLFCGIILSAVCFAANIAVAFQSSKFSAGDADIMKIIKTVGAGYFIPSLVSVIGFITNIAFGAGGYALSFSALVFSFIPYYLATSELNRKNKLMTWLPTVVSGLVNIIIAALIYGLTF